MIDDEPIETTEQSSSRNFQIEQCQEEMDLDINMDNMNTIMESSELDWQIQKDIARPVVIESTDKNVESRNDNNSM